MCTKDEKLKEFVKFRLKKKKTIFIKFIYGEKYNGEGRKWWRRRRKNGRRGGGDKCGGGEKNGKRERER